MRTNTDCTIIRADGSTTYVNDCMWQDVEAIEIKKYGAENADKATIYISGTSITAEKGEYIAQGTETDIHIALLITSVSKKGYSNRLNHIQIGAK